jgi:multisubunit Na+/H+ antiporter MnhE subunit
MERIRSAGFWVLAWFVGAALWLLLTDSPKLPELLAGALVAAIAASGTEVVRRQGLARIALRPSLLRRALVPIVGAVPDCGRLVFAAFAQLFERRPARGRIVAIPFGHGGDAPAENGRRALAMALGSFAPNTIVVGIDPERERLLAHQLVPTREPSDLDPLGLR